MDELPPKRCSKCHVLQPIGNFYFIPSKGRHYSYCRLCHNSYQKARNQKTPLTEGQKLRQKANRLKRDFSISLVQYLVLGDQQEWACAICDEELKVFHNNTQVDHCHLTGQVRGILCGPCNKVLGLMKDSPTRLQRAIHYLGFA